MKLRYTHRALDELDEILTYIAQHSPQGARRVHLRIRAVIEMLLQHPRSGRRTTNPRLRRIAATPFPYLIFYELRDDELVIIGIRHGARHSATMPGGD